MTRSKPAPIAAAAVGLMALGFLMDGRGFVGNLIAAAFESLLTATIIAWLIEQGNRRRWARARGHILLSVTHHMAGIAQEFKANLERDEVEELMARQDLDGDIAEGYDYPLEEAERAIAAIANLMRNSGHELMSRQAAENLHESIRGDLAQVRGSLASMTVALGDEPELAGFLSEFEHAARCWTSHFPLSDCSAAYHYIDAVDLMNTTSRNYSCCLRLFEKPRLESVEAHN